MQVELMYPYYAHGLDGILTDAAWKLTGITNGIDVNTFNPATDPALPWHYDAQSFRVGKADCKAALQQEVGLPVKPDVPMLVMVTRLAGHKDWTCCAILPGSFSGEEDCQMVILGTGEDHFERFFKGLQEEFPDRVAALITFNLGLASPHLRRRRHLYDALKSGVLRPEPDERHALRYGSGGPCHRRPEGHLVPLWTSMGRAAWALPSRLPTGTISWRLWERIHLYKQEPKTCSPAAAGHGAGFQLGQACPAVMDLFRKK